MGGVSCSETKKRKSVMKLFQHVDDKSFYFEVKQLNFFIVYFYELT